MSITCRLREYYSVCVFQRNTWKFRTALLLSNLTQLWRTRNVFSSRPHINGVLVVVTLQACHLYGQISKYVLSLYGSGKILSGTITEQDVLACPKLVGGD